MIRIFLVLGVISLHPSAHSRELEFPRTRNLWLYEKATSSRRLTLLPESLGGDMRRVFGVMRKAGCELADPSGGYNPNKDGICDSAWRCPNSKVEAIVESVGSVTGIRDDESLDARRASDYEAKLAEAQEMVQRVEAVVRSLERSKEKAPVTCAFAVSERGVFKTYVGALKSAMETTMIRLVFLPFRPSDEVLAEGRQACLGVRFEDVSAMKGGPAGIAATVDPTNMAAFAPPATGVRLPFSGTTSFRACGYKWEGDPWEDLAWNPACARSRHKSYVVHGQDPDAARAAIEKDMGFRTKTSCGFVPFPASQCGPKRLWLHYRIPKEKVAEFEAQLAALSTLAPLSQGARNTDPLHALARERSAVARMSAAGDLNAMLDAVLQTPAGSEPDGAIRATVLLCPGKASVSRAP